MFHKLLWLAVGLFVAGCGLTGSPAGPEDDQAPPQQAPASTAIALPTLYPSATPPATALPTETRPVRPTEPPDTPVAFDQVSVELQYSIPGLDLNRKLVGNVSGQLEITDETTGRVAARNNQPGILIEMQQALPRVTLEELPAQCDLCVQLAYRLPLGDVEASGWLTDVQMLASVENFTSVYLGPHFPADTVVGLRRSATPYSVAHTVALTGDGQLWRWTAVEAQIDSPIPAGERGAALAEALTSLDAENLQTAYAEDCPQQEGIETLFLKTSNSTRQIQLACPELVLPADLLPLYLQLDALAAEELGDEGPTGPEPIVPLSAIIQYQAGETKSVIVFQDGRISAQGDNGKVVTGTLESTQVISLTQSLIDSGALEVGAEAVVSGTYTNTLFVRGPQQVHSLAWAETLPAAIADQVAALDALWQRAMMASETEEIAEPQTPALTPQATTTP